MMYYTLDCAAGRFIKWKVNDDLLAAAVFEYLAIINYWFVAEHIGNKTILLTKSSMELSERVFILSLRA